jgi:imidazole glycerol-phosphate synthase subunit HisH
MPEVGTAARVALAATGVANIASIMAAFRRAGAVPYLAADPADLAGAAFAVVPGVGSFGSAMAALREAGMDEAIRDRITRGAPTLGVCAGMQVFFEESEESPGVAGLGLVGGSFRRFPPSLPVPQLGWNRVVPRSASLDCAERSSAGEARSATSGAPLYNAERSSAGEARSASPGLIREGWAYFANSYRLSEAPEGLASSLASYGEPFVAAAERPGLLLCQFHPELSGPWGLSLIERWIGAPLPGKGAAA